MINHPHTADCLAVNELNELCCLHAAVNADMCRYTVSIANADIHTFTDSDDDAIALAYASRPDLASCAACVTYRDTTHALDDEAHYGYIRDVPNPD